MTEHRLEVEILRVGTWNGSTFTRPDLEELAQNFRRLMPDLRVPLKFGHDDRQTLLGQADGDPALGWVTDVRVEGDRLIATLEHLPAIVLQAIEAKLYRHVSVEVLFNVKLKHERLGMVLVGLALLGADLPAVSGLADLGAYLGQSALTADVGARLAIFSMPRSGVPSEEEDMNVSKPGGGAATLEVLQGQVATLTAKLSALEGEKAELLRQQDSTALQARAERFAAHRRDLLDKLEARVRTGTLTPAARDRIATAIQAQEPEFQDALVFTAAQVEALLAGVTALPSGERASDKGREAAASHADPRVEHSARTRDLMASEQVDFAEASIRALQRDPALRKRLQEFRVKPVDALSESEAA